MKTTAVLFVLVVGCMIPAYSQLNRHRKLEQSADQFLQKMDKGYVFGKDELKEKTDDSWKAWTPYNLKIAPVESASAPTLNKSTGHTYSQDLMPVLKPEGVFHMRLFQPEGKYFMKVYLLDW